MAHIEIARGRCIGAAQCVLSAPELFDQDEDGIVVVLDDAPGGELVEFAHTAAMVCPSQSISVAAD
ncbi:ferredoxin [Krasilnikovia cinnamomea]|uniref:Ferredoxin n=1 Tax=Krasilnikovia cinnamomea TaxID=349313 RepID=A0A4Q7ZSL0_9ACTN|nr:ferredoxin [Krasilnikovia cinnamomea]RZU54182.1 ferredoxin [Krasilnikovia cinnamomea]